jgi:hypothetical protein
MFFLWRSNNFLQYEEIIFYYWKYVYCHLNNIIISNCASRMFVSCIQNNESKEQFPLYSFCDERTLFIQERLNMCITEKKLEICCSVLLEETTDFVFLCCE